MPKSIKELFPDLSDEQIFDELRDSKVVHEELHDERRWYQLWEKVVEVDGHFFRFYDYHCTGDDSPSDMGLTDDISDIVEVEEYEKVVKAYRKIES